MIANTASLHLCRIQEPSHVKLLEIEIHMPNTASTINKSQTINKIVNLVTWFFEISRNNGHYIWFCNILSGNLLLSQLMSSFSTVHQVKAHNQRKLSQSEVLCIRTSLALGSDSSTVQVKLLPRPEYQGLDAILSNIWTSGRWFHVS